MKKETINSNLPIIAAALLLLASICLVLSAYLSNRQAVDQSIHSAIHSVEQFFSHNTATDKLDQTDNSEMWKGLDENEKALLAFQMKDKSYLNQRERQLYTQLQQFHSLISSDMSDYQKALSAYDYVCSHCTYNHDAADNTDVDAYTYDCASAYGALVDRYAVCAGYGQALKFLLDSTDVDCLYVTGTVTTGSGETEKHAWNMIRIEGKYYHADCTWDDSDGYVQNSHAYFLKSDAFMKCHREWAYEDYPNCSSPYVRNDDVFKTQQDAEQYIVDMLCTAPAVEVSVVSPLQFDFLQDYFINRFFYIEWSSDSVMTYCLWGLPS